MKKCPTCEKTFDDAMRFCQTDGTPLVEAAEPVDPYKTVVAKPEDIAAAIPSSGVSEVSSSTESPTSLASDVEGDDLLQLPDDSDARRTIIVSEEEIRKEMAAHDKAEDVVMEIPPLTSEPLPEPPMFSEPSLSPPTFGVTSPPASPFAEPGASSDSPFAKTGPPIPSPFGDATTSTPETPSYPEPEPTSPAFASPEPEAPSFTEPQRPSPSYAEPEPASFNPFNQPAQEGNLQMAQQEWNPPPSPDPGWQNQPIGQNTPFQPPPAAGGEGSPVLGIISLVFGCISLCCYVSPLTGLVALITGFLAIRQDPPHPVGKGLAIAGMIAGGIMFLIGTAYYIIVILVYGGIIGASMLQGF